jgi:DNA-binding transcriptional MocR family regulator
MARQESRVTVQGIIMGVAAVEGISQVDRLVAAVLAAHANTQGEAWPSLQRLALMTGLARRTVQRSLQRLDDRHVISIERGGGRMPGGRPKPSRYSFFPDNDGPDFDALEEHLWGSNSDSID